MECVIISAEPERERISASVRRLTEDIIGKEFERLIEVGKAQGRVTAIKEEGIIVSIVDRINTFMHKEEFSDEPTKQDPLQFSIGQTIDLKVVSFDKNKRFANISIKALLAAADNGTDRNSDENSDENPAENTDVDQDTTES